GHPRLWLHALVHVVLLRKFACHEVIPSRRPVRGKPSLVALLPIGRCGPMPRCTPCPIRRLAPQKRALPHRVAGKPDRYSPCSPAPSPAPSLASSTGLSPASSSVTTS